MFTFTSVGSLKGILFTLNPKTMNPSTISLNNFFACIIFNPVEPLSKSEQTSIIF